MILLFLWLDLGKTCRSNNMLIVDFRFSMMLKQCKKYLVCYFILISFNSNLSIFVLNDAIFVA
jgi:hypothetical protein